MLAVILRESGGVPDVVNTKSKATGLMQVMPRDSDPSVARYFEKRPTSEELKDPETNLMWGCSILGGLLKQHGDERTALYHYSGGRYWSSMETFDKLYWSRIQAYRLAIRETAQICWRVTHGT